MNVAVATCRERNANRGRDRNARTRIADEIFERIVTRFEAPNGRQNSWEVTTSEVKGTGDGFDVDDVMNALIQRANLELHRRHVLQAMVQGDAAQQVGLLVALVLIDGLTCHTFVALRSPFNAAKCAPSC